MAANSTGCLDGRAGRVHTGAWAAVVGQTSSSFWAARSTYTPQAARVASRAEPGRACDWCKASLARPGGHIGCRKSSIENPCPDMARPGPPRRRRGASQSRRSHRGRGRGGGRGRRSDWSPNRNTVAELVPRRWESGTLDKPTSLGAVAALSDDPRPETRALPAYQPALLKPFQIFPAAHARFEKQRLVQHWFLGATSSRPSICNGLPWPSWLYGHICFYHTTNNA